MELFLNTKLLLFWILFNFVIGLYELYIYKNKSELKIKSNTWWLEPSSNYLIDSWSEYCKVDTRYIYKLYVWFFELFNAITAIILLFMIVFVNLLNIFTNSKIVDFAIIKFIILIIIFLQLVNCCGYFISLTYEWIKNKHEITRYAKWWMYPIYYGISSIWIIIPLIILLNTKY